MQSKGKGKARRTKPGTGRRGGAALIRAAAVDVLLAVGLRAATTRMVTDQAGVGRGLLNHYFRWPDLRAAAWESIFAAVTTNQFPADQPPGGAEEITSQRSRPKRHGGP